MKQVNESFGATFYKTLQEERLNGSRSEMEMLFKLVKLCEHYEPLIMG